MLYVSKCFLYWGLSGYNLAFGALSFVAANKIIDLVLDHSWKMDVVVGTLWWECGIGCYLTRWGCLNRVN